MVSLVASCSWLVSWLTGSCVEFQASTCRHSRLVSYLVVRCKCLFARSVGWGCLLDLDVVCMFGWGTCDVMFALLLACLHWLASLICMVPWCIGAFDSLIASLSVWRQHTSKMSEGPQVPNTQ